MIGNIRASACISTVSIRLSEYQEKKICDTIERFPKNRLILQFEGYWTEIEHNEQSMEFIIQGKANLNPSAISIDVLSDQISF